MKLRRFITLTATVLLLQAAALWAQVPEPSSRDVRFLRQAARLGSFQFELGQLALTLGPTQDIRDFGLREAADHSGINRQLTELAESLDVDLPTDLNRNQERLLDRLTDLAEDDGDRFIRAYLRESIKTHKQILQLFETEADRGQHPAITDFAQRYLGMLQNHLDEARELRDNL